MLCIAIGYFVNNAGQDRYWGVTLDRDKKWAEGIKSCLISKIKQEADITTEILDQINELVGIE